MHMLCIARGSVSPSSSGAPIILSLVMMLVSEWVYLLLPPLSTFASPLAFFLLPNDVMGLFAGYWLHHD